MASLPIRAESDARGGAHGSGRGVIFVAMRRFIRHPSSVPIEIRTEAIPMGHCRVFDVSVGGLAFDSQRELAAGVQIWLRIPLVRPAFIATAHVVWCKPEGGGFRIGVTFLDSHDAFRARMVEQICHIESYRKRVLALENRDLPIEDAALEWIEKCADEFSQLNTDDD